MRQRSDVRRTYTTTYPIPYTSASFMTSLLLRPRPRNPSTDNTRQLFLPNTKQQPNAPAHRSRKQNAQPSQKPELRTDILLLTRRSTPADSLRPALAIRRDRLSAPAGETISLFIFAQLGRVFVVGGAMSGAVVGCGDGSFEGGVTDGEDGCEGHWGGGVGGC